MSFVAALVVVLLGPVYGTPEVPLRFAHARHAAVPCATCHAAEASARPGDRLLPAEAVCFGCHVPGGTDGKGDGTADGTNGTNGNAGTAGTAQMPCASCHPGYQPASLPPDPRETTLARPWPAPVEWPAAALTFGHRPHLARGATCADCHAGVEASTDAATTHLPSMTTCMDCHTARGASNRCATCHPTGPDGVIVTALPAGPLVPRGGVAPDHRGVFAREHRAAALADPALCASCHTEASCERCHASHVKPVAIHAFDYVRLHGIDAKRSPDGCDGCHRAETFCLDCHVRSGVSIAPGPTQFGVGDGTARFHPPGFAGSAFEPPGPGHHRVAARRNLRECVSCHRESECVTCHGVEAPIGLRAGSPHPPGFDCGALGGAMRGCVKCHADRGALVRLCAR